MIHIPTPLNCSSMCRTTLIADMSDKSLTTKIIAAGALVGAVVAMLTAWGTYGWVTRDVYAQDHLQGTVEEELHKQEAANTKILALLEEVKSTQNVIQKAQVKNQDQWECDETDEELEEILDKEDRTGLSSSEKRDKAKLEEVWIEKRCTRFTD